jgi:rare lipoprotein A
MPRRHGPTDAAARGRQTRPAAPSKLAASPLPPIALPQDTSPWPLSPALCFLLALALVLVLPSIGSADTPTTTDAPFPRQVGKASYYADFFEGRRMANGERYDPDSNVAASRTLPLGTTARVTNLDNGRSAVVVIKDRGPYVDGRIVDLTPRTAGQLDMLEDGVVPVEVQPLSMPGKGRR